MYFFVVINAQMAEVPVMIMALRPYVTTRKQKLKAWGYPEQVV